MTSLHQLDQIYYGTVASRLDLARKLLRTLEPQLSLDLTFQQDIRLLQKYGEDLAEHMQAMHLGPLCSRCATGPSGGCCSLFMSNETDSLQMLMNLLVGVEVQMVRDDGQECVFLGDNGCIFLFKPMFCLNYNCKHIATAATAGDLAKLEILTGLLLTKQYAVEQYLLAQL